MKRSQPKRDWRAANRKRDLEGNTCRNCGSVLRVELAHVIGREHDKEAPIFWDEEADGPWSPYRVAPARVILLCGPATDTTTCHGKQHAGRLDVGRLLDREEAAQAAYDAGTLYSAAVALYPDLNPRRFQERLTTN